MHTVKREFYNWNLCFISNIQLMVKMRNIIFLNWTNCIISVILSVSFLNPCNSIPTLFLSACCDAESKRKLMTKYNITQKSCQHPHDWLSAIDFPLNATRMSIWHKNVFSHSEWISFCILPEVPFSTIWKFALLSPLIYE